MAATSARRSRSTASTRTGRSSASWAASPGRRGCPISSRPPPACPRACSWCWPPEPPTPRRSRPRSRPSSTTSRRAATASSGSPSTCPATRSWRWSRRARCSRAPRSTSRSASSTSRRWPARPPSWPRPSAASRRSWSTARGRALLVGGDRRQDPRGLSRRPRRLTAAVAVAEPYGVHGARVAEGARLPQGLGLGAPGPRLPQRRLRVAVGTPGPAAPAPGVARLPRLVPHHVVPARAAPVDEDAHAPSRSGSAEMVSSRIGMRSTSPSAWSSSACRSSAGARVASQSA